MSTKMFVILTAIVASLVGAAVALHTDAGRSLHSIVRSIHGGR